MFSFLTAALLDWRFYCILALLYVAVFYIRYTFSGLPRGPVPLPLIGNLHQLGGPDALHEGVTKLGQIYGDVFTVYFASQPVVFLNSYKAVDEAFVKKADVTSGRPGMFVLQVVHRGDHGKMY